MLNQLLTIEADENLWDAEVNGLHLWTLIRHVAMLKILLPDFVYHATGTKAYYHPRLWKQHLATLPTLLSLSRSKKDIIVFKSSHTRTADYDRLYAPYEQYFPSQLVFELWADTDINKPAHPNYLSDNALRLLVAIRAKRQRLTPQARRICDAFAAHVVTLLALPSEEGAYLANIMKQRLQRYLVLRKLLENIAQRIPSRLALVHHAASMGHEALVTRTLHELGFQIAEVQHGAIHPLGIDYLYHESLCQYPHPAMQQYLPDVILTFGGFWSSVIRAPMQKMVIGYPHLTEKVASIEAETSSNPKKILVISQFTISETIAQIAAHIAPALPDYQIIIKLHPLHESPDAPYFKALAHCPNIDLIRGGDLYQMIAESSIIVGSYSTVIYEAFAFHNKRIFVQRNERIDPSIGTQFDTPEELLALLKDEASGYTSQNVSWFWEQDWQAKMAAFKRQYT